MKKFITLLLCFSVMCQFCVAVHAEDVIPYDEDEVIDFEFPGYYDEELGRIVMYEELVSPYAFVLDDFTYACIGLIAMATVFGFSIVGSDNFQELNMAFWKSVFHGLSETSQSIAISIGKLFQRGQAISFSAISGISDAISELKQAIVDIAAAQGIPDFSFTKGSVGSLSYTVANGSYKFAVKGFDKNNKMISQPWLYASGIGATFLCRTSYATDSSRKYYIWHGIGNDAYGSYWYYFSSSSMYGYSVDNITPSSVIAIPDGVSITKIYLSSNAAYSAAVGEGTNAMFLKADSVIRSYYTGSSTSWSSRYYGPAVSRYASSGSLTDSVNVGVWGAYQPLDGYFVETESTSILDIEYNPTADILVPTDEGVIDFTIPDGLTLDTNDVGQLLITLPQTVADRIAGTEAGKAEEAEKQGLLQNIYQTVVSIPEAIGAWITDIPGILQEAEQAIAQEIEEAAPIQLFKDKCLSIELIYNAGADFLNGILDLEPEPPVIYVDMTKSRSQIIKSDNDKVPILDMHFYEEYKPYGDKIISGILWAFFLFRLWMRAPDIVSGAGMVATSVVEAASDDKKRKVK